MCNNNNCESGGNGYDKNAENGFHFANAAIPATPPPAYAPANAVEDKCDNNNVTDAKLNLNSNTCSDCPSIKLKRSSAPVHNRRHRRSSSLPKLFKSMSLIVNGGNGNGATLRQQQSMVASTGFTCNCCQATVVAAEATGQQQQQQVTKERRKSFFRLDFG
ncbi:Hypothetical predicted protein, partial [Drosophila guanche]